MSTSSLKNRITKLERSRRPEIEFLVTGGMTEDQVQEELNDRLRPGAMVYLTYTGIHRAPGDPADG